MKIFLILIICNIIRLSTSINLIIKESEKNNKYFIERDRLLSLSCESDSISQKEMIQWFLPSFPSYPVINTDSTERVSIKDEFVGNKKRVVLSIRDVATDSSGTYYCKSFLYESNSQTLLAQAFVTVNVFKPITIINCESEQYIMINTKGLLRCELDSDPKAFVVWVFKGQQLSQTEKYRISPTDLTISNVVPSDAGHYVVQARQIDYKSSLIKDIIVKTFERPKITVGPRMLRPITNGVVEDWYSDIQCLAEGNPQPTVHWFRKRNGDEELQLVNSQRYFVNTNPKVGTLRISRPVYPDDNDVYTCKAMLPYFMVGNIEDVTYDSRSINVSVSIYPQFTQTDRMHTLIEAGKTAVIQCRVRTTDPVDLIWQKFNYPAYQYGVQPSDSRIKVSLTKEPFDQIYQVLRLEISNVTYSDSWNYSCIAHNPGFNLSYNGTISVRQRPILSKATPRLGFGWLFNATNLTCISHGLPHPRWQWYRYRYSVENDINSTFRVISWDSEIYSQSWLQILPDLSSQYWIFDDYECQARNDFGEDRQLIKLVRASVPAPPQVMFVNSTSSSLTFKISPPTSNGGMEVLHYEMVYRAMTGPASMYGPVFYRPDETIIEMSGLVQSTSYTIAFYSCNNVGRSSDNVMNEMTKYATVPDAVHLIHKVKSSYPYGYNVQWDIPLDGGYPLLGYRIQLQALRRSENYKGNVALDYLVNHPDSLVPFGPKKTFDPLLVNPYISMFRLDDLEAETVYKVSVSARNQLGFSNSSSMYFYTPTGDLLGKPARVRGLQTHINTLNPFIYFILTFLVLVIPNNF